MATYFSLILVLITLVTGIIWALDKFIWAKARAEKVAMATARAELPPEAIAKLGQESVFVENAKSIFPVIAAVMILRSFLYEPFQIPSGSMMPTLLVGDFILVEKYAYGIKDPVFRSTLVETGKPERGDIVVFKFPPEPTVDYIKRVVGLPGDRIAYRGKKVFIKKACPGTDCQVYKKLDLSLVEVGKFKDDMVGLEQYKEQLGEVSHSILINPKRSDMAANFYQQPHTLGYEWVVPPGHYFVMGDNRDNSADSRFWGFVPDANLVGKAVFIWTSFEFDRDADSVLPSWIPTGIRFNRIGKLN